MGNQRFKLSDMIPNAWFYKLRDMNKTTHNHKPPLIPSSSSSSKPSRNSFYYTPRVTHFYNSPPPNISHFHDPPPKRLKPRRKTIYKPSPKPTESTPSSESTRESCSCRVSSSTTDIIIDVNEKSFAKKIQNSHGFDDVVQLPPIKTKPKIKMVEKTRVNDKKEEPGRKSTSGVKIRSNSPKIGVNLSKSKRGSDGNKKKLRESCAIVKSSFDPEKDFRESMVEMIIENNIRASKDLEHLLACYLSLNSDEYHHLIVKAFEQIWFNLPHL